MPRCPSRNGASTPRPRPTTWPTGTAPCSPASAASRSSATPPTPSCYPAWTLAAAHRTRRPSPLPRPVEDALFDELLARHRDHRSFGLAARPLLHREENTR
ncbi:hypothetical protein ACFQ3Z_01680 [Streptomyces nogalater]